MNSKKLLSKGGPGAFWHLALFSLLLVAMMMLLAPAMRAQNGGSPGTGWIVIDDQILPARALQPRAPIYTYGPQPLSRAPWATA